MSPRSDAAPPPRRIPAPRGRGAPIRANDPRWVLAVRAAHLLEGGRTAAMPPQRRERLIRTAEALGLRAFDANLIIAIVQDGARSGEGPLGATVADRLRLVRPAARAERAWGRLADLACSVGLAVVLTLLAARWIAGG